eukprot:10500086-Alexandrium_andersonii.AAC.1
MGAKTISVQLQRHIATELMLSQPVRDSAGLANAIIGVPLLVQPFCRAVWAAEAGSAEAGEKFIYLSLIHI